MADPGGSYCAHFSYFSKQGKCNGRIKIEIRQPSQNIKIRHEGKDRCRRLDKNKERLHIDMVKTRQKGPHNTSYAHRYLKMHIYNRHSVKHLQICGRIINKKDEIGCSGKDR